MSRLRLLTAAVLAAAAAAPATASALTAGDLDPSFGTGGIAPVALSADASASLPAGGTVHVNRRLEVLRLRADGSLDPAFGGGDGVHELDLDGSGSGYAVDGRGAIAVDSRGRVVVVGTWSAAGRDVAAVARLLPDGSFDATFSGTGRMLVEFSAADATEGAGVAIAPGDAIVVAGQQRAGALPVTLGAARLTESGQLDPGFSGDGRVTVPLGEAEHVGGVAVDAAGRVVIAGAGAAGGGPDLRGVPDDEATVVRLTAAGAPDPAFSGDGVARFAAPGADPVLADVATDAQGRVVVAGSSGLSSWRPAGFVARLTAGGALDPGFAGDGVDQIALGPEGGTTLTGLALQGDGAVLAAGLTARDAQDLPRATAVRFGPGGARDTAFGVDGVRRFGYGDAAGTYEQVGDVVVDAQGGIVVAGAAYEPRARGTRGENLGSVARLLGRGDAPQQPGGGDGGDGGGGGGGTAGGPGGEGPAQPVPGAAPRPLSGPARRTAAPTATIDRIRGRSPRRFSGRSTGSVRRVEVAVVRQGAERVRWLRAKGTARWSLTVRRRLARGRYELRVRAVGAGGVAGPPARKAFRVR